MTLISKELIHCSYFEELYTHLLAENERLGGKLGRVILLESGENGLLLAGTAEYNHPKDVFGKTNSEVAFIITPTGIYENITADRDYHRAIMELPVDEAIKADQRQHYLQYFYIKKYGKIDFTLLAVAKNRSLNAMPEN